MFRIRNTVVLAITFLAVACQPEGKQDDTKGPAANVNPAAEGFNYEASDSLAIAIADQVMAAMGGRDNWDDTRYITWNFFGGRQLLWDKKTGDVRIKSDDKEIIVNIRSMEGMAIKDGKEITHPDSLKKYLDEGRNIWRNDSYWLVMPFKLKDSGVTLTYVREARTLAGEEADMLELRFSNVGHTPQNKYYIWVDKQDHLVKQFAYYKDASQNTANFVLPWKDYKQYGGILLSGDRGDRQLTDIAVLESVPEDIFTSFETALPE